MENRKYIIITLLGHQIRYYDGWNVLLTPEQLLIVGVAVNRQERYHHKTATTYVYKLTDNNEYVLSEVYGKASYTMRNRYTPEQMQELEEMVHGKLK